MICAVFIATSVDGYIARLDHGVEWLESAGKPEVDLGDQADMGFYQFIASVDCMIMGRKTLEKLVSFNLTPDQWPYGNIRIITLSKTLKSVPPGLPSTVELFAGEISQLVKDLERAGFKQAYIDGGRTITAFLQEKLINEITITHALVLLGSGIPLFGKFSDQVRLENTKVTVFPNDFVQIKYTVDYR